MNKFYIKNLEINIYDTIKISLSGGADSAILAYFLMKFTDKPIHFFTVAVEEKKFVTLKHSSDVIKECIKLTKNNNTFHHIKYVSKFDNSEYQKFLLENVNLTENEVMYTGLTSIPSFSELLKFKNKLDVETINKRLPNFKKSYFTNSNKFYHPFRNINKVDIKNLYDEFNLMSSLFPVTRSCESLEILDKHCNQCWWCEERQWAFNNIN